ncbi:MAG: alpha-glucoside transport system substrate-binding protein, partial [Polaromonas sp.]
MKKSFYAGAAILALIAGMASAEGHLAGEQVTVFGPWLGPDQAAVEEVLA